MGRRATKEYSDIWFLMTLGDSDSGKLKHDLSPFQTRPAYVHTKSEVGGIGEWSTKPTKN